jgi:hypothetical protein
MLDRGEDRQPDQDEGDRQGKGQAEHPMSLQKRGRRPHSGPNTLAPPVRTSSAHVLGPLAKHEATGPLTRPVNLGCYQQVPREKRLRTGCPVTKRAPSRMAGLSLSVEPRARVTSYWARAFHKRLRSEEHPPGRVPPAARTGARVRLDGAHHLWRKVPSGELSIDPEADERLGRATGRVEAS